MKSTQFAVSALFSTCFIGGVHAQTPASAAPVDAGSSTALIDPDRGPSDRGATADSQKNDATDLNLTKRIRRSVIADRSLSTAAHNVDIIAVDGTVTLKGVVRNQNEKQTVETKATAIAGRDRVVNNLTIDMGKR